MTKVNAGVPSQGSVKDKLKARHKVIARGEEAPPHPVRIFHWFRSQILGYTPALYLPDRHAGAVKRYELGHQWGIRVASV